jgi:hypothetical protein
MFNFLERRCVECAPGTPVCGTCPTGQICSITIKSCDACQQTSCIPDPDASSAGSNSSVSNDNGPNVGAIAGGVIGGLAVVGLLTYLVWKFCIKNKRQEYAESEWVDEYHDATPAEKDFEFRRDQRSSTHTVGSIASTVLTRASNIIQIAYIPGVTNRSAPSTPGLLVPPVPPIPIALAGTPNSPFEDQHFFMPGDLRGSTYSGMTDRTSYAPRSSVASTIYGKSAVVSPTPALQVIRGKAAVVSVKSNGSSSPGDLLPPVPSVDFSKYEARGPPSPAFSVGSTFLNSATAATASSATTLRPTMVRVGSAGTKGSKGSDEEAHKSPLGRESAAITIIDDTPTMEQGPFSDPPTERQQKTKSLSAVIEEAAKKAAAPDLAIKREGTPFGDEHATE